MATGIFAAANHNSHWIASVAVPSEYRQNTQVYKKKQHPHARTFKQHRGETHNRDREQGNGQNTHTAALTAQANQERIPPLLCCPTLHSYISFFLLPWSTLTHHNSLAHRDCCSPQPEVLPVPFPLSQTPCPEAFSVPTVSNSSP